MTAENGGFRPRAERSETLASGNGNGVLRIAQLALPPKHRSARADIIGSAVAAAAAAAPMVPCRAGLKPCPPTHPNKTWCPDDPDDKNQCKEPACAVARKPCNNVTRPGCYWCPALKDTRQCSKVCPGAGPGGMVGHLLVGEFWPW